MQSNDWSRGAVERVDAVQCEIERANPVFAECPEEAFKPYLRWLFGVPEQASGPLMLGPALSRMKRDGLDEATRGRFKAYARAMRQRQTEVGLGDARPPAPAPAPARAAARAGGGGDGAQ